MWNRPDVDFVHTADLPWVLPADGEFGATGGGRKRVLSRDPGDGAETAVHRIADRCRGVLAAEVDAYVLAGGGLLNGRPVEVNDYLHIDAGSAVDLRPGVRGLVLYCGFWATPGLTAGDGPDGVSVTSTERLTWTPATWSGEVELAPGAMLKTLRHDDRAYIYLAAMMPGWRSEAEESHPVYEESFKIYGDVLMGARGVMRDGAYFFRSPDVFHGPLYSRGGTMSFIRSDAATTTEYRDPPPGGAWNELARQAYVD
ncbi:hypothetical protein BLA60_02710 [Actinophytocola xinjiangensis]|uniref:DUF4437 domain-containing protein n=1 Tax=Actinophytocola xinjiangensis TaxID=485602 RepID=A0A7Z1B0S5_9PSEU|nr:DUF4437 domain-containing protein [Actinophytocola xinjiangensis]OLF14093.1 hypothetical protein BLA60_02710 [Actinophytocola xinjiangensis]